MTDRQSTGFGLDGVLLAAAAVVLAVGTVVWGGAALAAAVAGGDFDGGLSGAIRAAMRLPEEWREPRMAWERPADQEALPGPALYWAATVVVAVAASGVVAVGMRVWRASRDRGRVRLGVETRARFATGVIWPRWWFGGRCRPGGSCSDVCTVGWSRRRIDVQRSRLAGVAARAFGRAIAVRSR